MENKNNHETNKKKIEYYINRLQSLNENGDEIKMEIEDPLENQEKEYESKNAKKNKKKQMSLIPLAIVLILFFNLIIYNKYGENNIFIPFITFAISIYIIHKYVPEKAKAKFIKDFEVTFKKMTDLFFFISRDINRQNKLKKYISVSSDDQSKLLKENENDDEKDDNYIESPLLNI